MAAPASAKTAARGEKALRKTGRRRDHPELCSHARFFHLAHKSQPTLSAELDRAGMRHQPDSIRYSLSLTLSGGSAAGRDG
ncbi:hypothetical protein [Sphingopyxis panaciterrae]